MQFSFDLISDLHTETWPEFDWTHRATSPYCVVAGDVSQDHTNLKQILKYLGQCYQAVFYIDGNDEHRNQLDNLTVSYKNLARTISRIKNVVYLQNNIVINNGVAILATNGWWGFDFDMSMDQVQSQYWYANKMQISMDATNAIISRAQHDAVYLMNSVQKLQKHQDVKRIIIVTHTVPRAELIDHDISLVDTWRFNATGNSLMSLVLNGDLENKIKTWCFGHYHGQVDRTINGIRYINNCRGRGNTQWSQQVYHPLRIEVNF